ncbi:hypothetical protein FAM09_25110 [Niastella caeni]|uniref:Sulfatase N-terminal domain-containing protein n=1 Tax=Niastella caeni TaxID=2569763 RepID=A0A4S8HEW2_9BACT|nr:sulfatase-like hydrolase/transferase [Niastella caeni]THU33433.1 hypothetical protein FAM09_25110 [Niastella caeni]
MQKIQQFLKAPYYFQWLILFFVLHGYNEFFGLIKISSLALLIVQLSAVAWVLFFICRKLYRDAHKAALFVTVLFFCYLFFGAFQDGLAAKPSLFYWSLFRTLIPVLAFICLVTFAGLFFLKRKPVRLTSFLSLLFVTLTLFDAVTVLWRTATTKNKKPLVAIGPLTPIADTVARPDVYLILLDEYMGTAALQEYYHYNNATFESFLKQQGFYVCAQPKSNYAFTVFSMSSLLNMRYHDSTIVGRNNGFTYTNLAALINHSAVSEYFKKFNYSIYNYSPFDFAGIDASSPFSIEPHDIELITRGMLYTRLSRRIIFGEPQDNLNVGILSGWLNKKVAASHENQMKSVLASAGKKSPAFTYLHLLMPHKPFLYDSTGKVQDTYRAVDGKRILGTDKLYLQYLVYVNKRIMRFVEQLQSATKGRAVIMVMSDHGYRDANSTGKDFRFINFNAVYLPNRDYHLWYDSVSNVNQFPLLFNTLFGQQIPLKKDSTCY